MDLCCHVATWAINKKTPLSRYDGVPLVGEGASNAPRSLFDLSLLAMQVVDLTT
jgi:hypothetical protein